MGTNKISVWSSLFFILTECFLFPFELHPLVFPRTFPPTFSSLLAGRTSRKKGGGATFVSRLSLYPPAQMPFRLVTQSSRKIACRVQSRSAYEGYDHIENLKISFKIFDILRFPSV